MSRARSLATLAILCTTMALWDVSAPSAQAQGPSYTRAKQEFSKPLISPRIAQETQQKVVAKIGGKDVPIVVGKLDVAAAPRSKAIIPGLGDEEPIEFMVKVWAELANPDGTGTGQYVNPQEYRWVPKQHVYLHFHSRERPIQVGLFEKFPGPGQARPTKPITPIPSIPSSYATLLPGQDVRLDLLLRIGDDPEADSISVVLMVAGAPVGGEILPINMPQMVGTGIVANPVIEADVLVGTTDAMLGVSEGSTSNAAAADQGTTLITNETRSHVPGGAVLVTKIHAIGPNVAEPSRQAEDVAIIMVCNGVLGANLLTLHK